jgi:hypothetical protein
MENNNVIVLIRDLLELMAQREEERRMRREMNASRAISDDAQIVREYDRKQRELLEEYGAF